MRKKSIVKMLLVDDSRIPFVFQSELSNSTQPTEDRRLYWQLSQGRMANFPAFIASKYFVLVSVDSTYLGYITFKVRQRGK